MPKLALIRHGQSQWNLENRFTGWMDVNLTPEGEAQARKAGLLLKAANVDFSCAFASLQTRAIRTLWLALEAMDRCWVPEEKSWRLNERHYGALTGLDKAETITKHGEEQVRIWRRSYDVPPPAQLRSDPFHPCHDRRYRDVPAALLPDGESLAMTLERVMPYWQEAIVPKLRQEHVLISAHGNSLRAIIKHVCGLSNAEIMDIEVPTGNPLLIDLDEDLRPISAVYLDPERAMKVPEIS